jgi:hypothetical protein
MLEVQDRHPNITSTIKNKGRRVLCFKMVVTFYENILVNREEGGSILEVDPILTAADITGSEWITKHQSPIEACKTEVCPKTVIPFIHILYGLSQTGGRDLTSQRFQVPVFMPIIAHRGFL